jgi:membrane-associated phospholipid phosphatase
MDTSHVSPPAPTLPPQPVSRRRFLGGLAAATVAATSTALPGRLTAHPSSAPPHTACVLGPLRAHHRARVAYHLRVDAARTQRDLPLPTPLCNGDEAAYLARHGNFHKALPHNRLGEVDRRAYQALWQALHSSNPADFERIPLGGTVKLANPQAAFAFTLEGPDAHHLAIPPAPRLDSAETAAEMVELYWHALTRDIPFADYDQHPLTLAAAAELSNLSDFRGPQDGGFVTPQTLFRGHTPGDLVGPYVSQFLWQDVPYGATTLVQQYRIPLPAVDYMTTFADWLAMQNGSAAGPTALDPVPRYLRTGRDLGEWVHRDFTYQGFLHAALILLSLTGSADPHNPYLASATQGGFVTFGGPHILDLVAKAARCALMATWYQKWLVHRRLRPEALGGLVQLHLTGAAAYPFLHDEVLHADAVAEVVAQFGTALLPMAYAEGCPTHPAYPAGHAAIAGACATMLKAFFNEAMVLPDPVVAQTDGLALVPYSGPDLTVGNELNKLAANVAIGRNLAGVHWRSDGLEGLRLGEVVALGMLSDLADCHHETFHGFTLTTFDGTRVAV